MNPTSVDISAVFARLGIALGLGLLVGLQRQRTDARLAGIRTFPLVTVLGAMCGLLAETYGGWVLAGGVCALALIIVGGNLPLGRVAVERPGLTTEVTLLAMFSIGAYLIAGSAIVAISVCGAIVVLLHLKPQMHALASKIGDDDFAAIVQFALISLVILPVLPNQTFGPMQVLNPFKIWLMVVLMVGISLAGYIVYKFVGSRAGAWTSGVLGGLISSTATTMSVARGNRESRDGTEMAAFVILVASGIAFLRLVLLVAATAPAFFDAAAMPLGTLFVTLMVCGWLVQRNCRGQCGPISAPTNPTALKTPLLFGVVYAVMLLIVAAANERYGRQGLYIAAAISGLTDMDAVTLSVTNLVNSDKIVSGTGWRVIVVAGVANLVFKASVVAVIGERRLLGRVAAGFGVAALVAAAFLYFGPN